MCITTQPVRNGVETLHETARFSSAKAYPPTFHDVAQMWIGCLVILPSLQWSWLSPSMCGLWGSHKRFWSWQTGRETNVAWATNGTNPTCSFALLRTTQSACRCRSEGETFKFETSMNDEFLGTHRWGFCCFIVGERLFLETRSKGIEPLVSPGHCAPRMWYPICVSTCPQGEAVVCPKNLNQETTTTSTTRTTANFYGSIRDARNGGLPYPPYPLPSVYQRYPSQHSFSDQPYLQPVPNYPPPIYPPGPPAGPWEGTPWPLGSVIYGHLPRVLKK